MPFIHRVAAVGLGVVLALIVAGCSRPVAPAIETTPVAAAPTPAATWTPAPTSTATRTPFPTASPTTTCTHTATPTVTASPTPTTTATNTPSPTATATATPHPYAGLTIDDLTARAYGGGEIAIEDVLEITHTFTRTLISYPSDGLTVYGFMNEPAGAGPFPVVLVLHGYIDPARYRTLAYTSRYADALARAGYLTIHPNYRNYPPSDTGPNELRIGFAIDVLNLIALVGEQAGREGPLAQAAPAQIGLFGHSMGGGIAQRVMTVNPDVRAVLLYGSMSGDDKRNFEQVVVISGGERGNEEAGIPTADLLAVSPVYYQDRITAAVSIHHGEADEQVPVEWSVELCRQLGELGLDPECFFYPGRPHTFGGEDDQLLLTRAIDFFGRHLRP